MMHWRGHKKILNVNERLTPQIGHIKHRRKQTPRVAQDPKDITKSEPEHHNCIISSTTICTLHQV
jgi:hypothetical protein